MTEWIWTRDEPWLSAWDAFQCRSPRGHYLQLTDWLRSYAAYGFDFELLVAVEGSTIVCGVGVVVAKVGPFRIHVAPAGPIVEVGHEALVSEAIERFRAKAAADGALLCQMNSPAVPQPTIPQLFDAAHLPASGTIGTAFREVSSIPGMRWLGFEAPGPDWDERMLMKFGSHTRRDINVGLRAGLEIRNAETPEEIEAAYRLFEDNARALAYPIRSWAQFGPTVTATIRKEVAVMPCAYKDGDLKGAVWLVGAGRRFSYISGAVKREKPNNRVGHVLQWHAIRTGHQMGHDGYDFTPGGSAGVVKFKEGFGTCHLAFVRGRFWALQPLRFKLFERLYPFASRHKTLISRILHRPHSQVK